MRKNLNHLKFNLCAGEGKNGIYRIAVGKGLTAAIVCSDGLGWDHVSVHIQILPKGPHWKGKWKTETPTWDQMKHIKDLFFEPSECVIQYHPPATQYVNTHSNCLHLWRSQTHSIPMPPSFLVGIKD